MLICLPHPGTFAVVSLMVGAVVDKGHIAWQRQELQGAMDDIRTGHNITHSIGDEGMITTASPYNENHTAYSQNSRTQHQSELDSIKLGYAMAVTFAVGVLQVNLNI